VASAGSLEGVAQPASAAKVTVRRRARGAGPGPDTAPESVWPFLRFESSR
jgi:hypothetical protein